MAEEYATTPQIDAESSLAQKTSGRRSFITRAAVTGFSIAFGLGCSSDGGSSEQEGDSLDTSPSSPENLPEASDLSYGVTLDRIYDDDGTYIVGEVVDILNRLPDKVSTRVVFDTYVDRIYRDEPQGYDIDSSHYEQAVDELSEATDIMGGILDSYRFRDYTVDQYRDRTKEYVDRFADKIGVWEIGNEVNGDWLLNDGEARQIVADKMLAAHEIVTAAGGETAITFYYNEGCAEPGHEMFEWIDTVLSDDKYEALKNVDQVLVSFYPEDCNNISPDWVEVFERLREKFPNSNLGFGEVGLGSEATPTVEESMAYLKEYYDGHMQTLAEAIPGFVGGGYWWSFYTEIVAPAQQGDTRMLDTLSGTMND